ncbi:LAQU0S04e03576g1_1 [Lachancea quebecensis]|uniref:LAQU0S04e03576g1_1 n=1 Tax=Lachancea quebecensis TaxID=1654605 RepID=A0A0N7MLC6_9SACH|nr:LAQU0S04e03576g1_1 [Lachancea quebecensis]
MSKQNDFISLSELIETDARFQSLREELAVYDKNSKEYLSNLISKLPLTNHVSYRQFLKEQAVSLDSSKKHGYSPVFRSSLSPGHLVSNVHPRLSTFFELFNLSVERFPDNDCLGQRSHDRATGQWGQHYEFESYRKIQERSQNLGSGIMTVVNLKRRQKFSSNDFIVSFLSTNRKEWVISDLACQSYSLANTALYETLGLDTSEYILNITKSPVLILSKENIYRVMEMIPKLPHLSTMICMDELSDFELAQLNGPFLPQQTNSKGERISILNFRQVERIGASNKVPFIPPTSESLYTISFTSGTTGTPKGVQMKQSHIAAAVAFVLSTLRMPRTKHRRQAYDLCFLPLAHIFERQIVAFDLSSGTAIGFLHKADPSVLVEDLKLLKPDVLPSVPRILTKFEAGIKNSLQNGDGSAVTKNVASTILNKRLERTTHRGGKDHSILNTLVFHRVLIDKIRSSLGLENLDVVITGSAPISNDTLLFMKSALDCGVRQGYGLTETFAGICLSEARERDSGTCGGMAITTECRLRSIPEMGYDAEHDLKGEVQLRGPQVFQGYYKNPQETSKALEEDGWYSTGDVGFIDSKGRLSIIDRVKNFFKLAQGEYIAPEKIESVYLSSCPYLTQIFVHGDSLQTFLVAVIGLDLDITTPIFHKKIPALRGIYGMDLVDEINKSRGYRKVLVALINSFIDGLQGFEKVHNLYVGIEPLKVADDTITPTLKVKRANAAKRFKKTLDELYEEGSLIKVEKL